MEYKIKPNPSFQKKISPVFDEILNIKCVDAIDERLKD